ncbi:hypothetical protein BKA62DRAFT_194336 [Auriculariales sp. MPI-PUGE-AT-0066]|nr:hypothetical protein BKA62DRAFT_194336 [Auriculariales sp. MPI-PUGE-AT-0066]
METLLYSSIFIHGPLPTRAQQKTVEHFLGSLESSDALASMHDVLSLYLPHDQYLIIHALLLFFGQWTRDGTNVWLCPYRLTISQWFTAQTRARSCTAFAIEFNSLYTSKHTNLWDYCVREFLQGHRSWIPGPTSFVQEFAVFRQKLAVHNPDCRFAEAIHDIVHAIAASRPWGISTMLVRRYELSWAVPTGTGKDGHHAQTKRLAETSDGISGHPYPSAGQCGIVLARGQLCSGLPTVEG